MAAAVNGRSARVRKFITRRGVELQFTELGFAERRSAISIDP